MEVRAAIAEERRRAADLVASLTPEQLRTPSLCAEWSVHDVAAHLLMPLVTPLPRLLLSMARHRFDFSRANVALTRSVARRSAADIAAQLRAKAEHPFRPPGTGYETPLTDLLVHQQDIRRPLGLGTDIDPDRLRVALALLASGKTRVVTPSARLLGLRFEATDVDWSAGNGAVVRGPGEAVLLAMAGRRVALDWLDGPGVAVLRERLSDEFQGP